MAVENKRCCGDGPSSSLLSSSGPEGERLSKIRNSYITGSRFVSDLSALGSRARIFREKP